MTRPEHNQRRACTSDQAETGCKQGTYESGPDALCYYHRKLKLPEDVMDPWRRPEGGTHLRRVLA